jgi:hypothetical protein
MIPFLGGSPESRLIDLHSAWNMMGKKKGHEHTNKWLTRRGPWPWPTTYQATVSQTLSRRLFRVLAVHKAAKHGSVRLGGKFIV